MAQFQVMSFEESFPAKDTFSGWINNKYTLITLLVLLLLIVVVALLIKNRQEAEINRNNAPKKVSTTT